VFRNDLKDKLSKIFGLRKTTFDQPSVNSTTGTFEQDTLFIEVERCDTRIVYGKQIAKVSGSLVVFSQMDKMPFGYFSKRIEQASHDLKKYLFFYDIDLNPPGSAARLQNISERRVRFIFLYSAQYDPEHGELTTLELGG
jgi:hypothetical protein